MEVGSDRPQGLWLGLGLGHSCDHMWGQVPLIPQSLMMEGTLSKKTLELISWCPCLFKLGSGLLLTFTSNTIVKGSENPQRDLSEGLLCLPGAIIYVLQGLACCKHVFTSISALALGRI